MPPVPKDPAKPAAPVTPASPGAKSVSDPTGRPQPVALEIPVTISGVRTVEGSSKREPFSESTQTVLVFGNGAVIRLAAALASGQLVFLTNEKTKKEVVCQVVKSKNYRTVTGYVELEFTEPASGFWGMRFPAERVVAPVPAAGGSRPGAASISAHTKPAASNTLVPPQPSAGSVPNRATTAPPIAPTSSMPAEPLKSPASANPPSQLVEPPSVVPVTSPAPAASALPPAANSEEPPSNVPKEIMEVFFRPVVSSVEAAPVSAGSSTPELEEEGSELEERLRASLFTPFTLKPAATSTETSQALLESPPVPVKSGPTIPKFPPIDENEIEIPAWLAPLARHSETAAEEPAGSVPATDSAETLAGPAAEEAPLPVEFRGHLLRDTASSRPKTRLIVGLAAVALLLIAAIVWYAQRPRNTVSGVAGPKPVTTNAANGGDVKTDSSKGDNKPATNTVNESVLSGFAFGETGAAPASISQPAAGMAKNTKDTEKSEPLPVDLAKRSSLGKVHLAKPVVGRSNRAAQIGEAAPAIDATAESSTSDPLATFAGTRNTPAMPAPVGGDVRQAKLIRSVPPVYPQLARSQHIGGDVQLDALIDAHGNVTTTKVLSGPSALHLAALQAVKQWKYEPAQLNGAPTAMHLTVTVQFRIQN